MTMRDVAMRRTTRLGLGLRDDADGEVDALVDQPRGPTAPSIRSMSIAGWAARNEERPGTMKRVANPSGAATRSVPVGLLWRVCAWARAVASSSSSRRQVR